MQRNNISFHYRITFPDNRRIDIPIELDRRTLQYQSPNNDGADPWARLENKQCPNCPLSPDEHPYCPVAKNLLDFLPAFKETYSYETAYVEVKHEQRNYTATTNMQTILSSIMGIYMVSSGCPILGQLKPMVRFHLPFASIEETIYRSVSTYLLKQYFIKQSSGTPDWELDGLKEIYGEIQKVNHAFCERLRTLGGHDAEVNGLIVLDVFAQALPMNIESHLQLLEYLFEDHTK